mgnify:CR=1 FL=1
MVYCQMNKGWRLAVYEGNACLYQTDIIIPYDMSIAYMNGLMDFGTFEKLGGKINANIR